MSKLEQIPIGFPDKKEEENKIETSLRYFIATIFIKGNKIETKQLDASYPAKVWAQSEPDAEQEILKSLQEKHQLDNLDNYDIKIYLYEQRVKEGEIPFPGARIAEPEDKEFFDRRIEEIMAKHNKQEFAIQEDEKRPWKEAEETRKIPGLRKPREVKERS